MTCLVLMLRGYIEARARAMAGVHPSYSCIPLVVNFCKVAWCLVVSAQLT